MFVVKLDTAGNHVWSKGFVGAHCQESSDCVAVDSTGAAVIIGWADGPIDFGGGPTADGSGFFVAKLDALGTLAWSKAFGVANVDEATAIAIAPSTPPTMNAKR